LSEPIGLKALSSKLLRAHLAPSGKKLQDPNEELKFRLRRVFRQLETDKFLLVLDDFEVNLEPRGDGYVLLPEAAMVLEALVWTIRETNFRHRTIITSRYDFQSVQLEHFYKQPLEALRGADLRKKCKRLAAFGEESKVQEALQSQAKGLADGNPRLLEWLDKILQNSTVDREVILQRLEADPVELREQVLAAALLEQMDGAMREMLSRGLVFELPVPREALVAVCETVPDLDGYINRAIALGLLEVSPDESLRVPRILPLQLPESAELLYQQAAEVLYRLWWEEEETRTEEQGMEIHRLALREKLGEMAADIAYILTSRWNNSNRWREALKTCQATLEVFEDYRIFHNLALSERFLGEVERASVHYQQALELCQLEDAQEKAAILHNLAGLYTQQGEIQPALQLYQQSLEITERIDDLQMKAATLHSIANIYAQRGEIQPALQLYQQSLEIKERIDDAGGKAATWHQMAGIYIQQGEIQPALQLYQQSLEITERIDDVRMKATTLHSMAGIYVQQGQVQQALQLYQQSLEITEYIDDVKWKAATLHSMAGIYVQQGEVQQALNLYQQSLEITERINDAKGKATTLHNMAGIYAQQGEIQPALQLYQQSLEITERINDVKGKATTLQQMAVTYAQQGKIQLALNLYQQSLEITERINNVKGKVAILQQMAGIYAQQGKIQQALNLYQQSLEITERINYVWGQAVTLHFMAMLYSREKFNKHSTFISSPWKLQNVSTTCR